MSRTTYQIFRAKTDKVSDDDAALSQDIDDVDDLTTIVADTTSGLSDHVKVEMLLLWTDVTPAVLRPQPGAGTFNVAHLKVSLDDSDPAETIIGQSTTAAEVGGRWFLLGDFRIGDRFSVRLTSITEGTAIGYRLYWRAIPQSSGGR